MRSTAKLYLGAVFLAIVLSAFAVGRLSADGPEQTPLGQSSTWTHERMHQMMDATHGEGTSDRVHETMGQDVEDMMDQCIAMMNMMALMRPMIDSMPGMGGQDSEADMQDMMRRMMGR